MKRSSTVRIRKAKSFLLSMSAILVLILFVIWAYGQFESDSILLLGSDHKCQRNGCRFNIYVLNEKHVKRGGFVRVNAFRMVGRVKSPKEELVATKRIEFFLEGGEERKITGFIQSEEIPGRLQISAGDR